MGEERRKFPKRLISNEIFYDIWFRSFFIMLFATLLAGLTFFSYCFGSILFDFTQWIMLRKKLNHKRFTTNQVFTWANFFTNSTYINRTIPSVRSHTVLFHRETNGFETEPEIENLVSSNKLFLSQAFEAAIVYDPSEYWTMSSKQKYDNSSRQVYVINETYFFWIFSLADA